MDEATLRIVVEDGGGDKPAAPESPRNQFVPSQPSYQPTPQRQPNQTAIPARNAAQPAADVSPAEIPVGHVKNEMPESVQPQERTNRERPGKSVDPAADARKKIEQEDYRAQVQAAYEKMRPAQPEEKPQRFDPRAEAGKQFETEVRKEQIKQTYERLYGSAKQTEGAFDQTLGLAQKMRGTLGGIFGPLVGSALDLVAAWREMNKATAPTEAEEVAKHRNYVESLPEATSAEMPETPAIEPATTAANEATKVQKNTVVENVPDNNGIKPEKIADTPAASVAKPIVQAAPIPQSKEIMTEANAALIALGQSQKEADQLLKQVTQSATRTFETVQEVIQAAYTKQPAKPAETVEVQKEPPTRTEDKPISVEAEIPTSDKVDAKAERGGPRQEPRIDSILGRERKLPAEVNDTRQENRPQETLSATTPDVPKPPATPEKIAKQDQVPKHETTKTAEIPTALHAPSGSGSSAPIAKAAPAAASPVPKVATAAPAAASAGGGMAAMASAAPVVGAIVAAGVAIQNAINGVIKGIVSGAGKLAAGFASPEADPAVPLRNLGDAASNVGEKMSGVVPVLGQLTMVAGEVGKSLADVMQALDKTATRYAEYNPEIAMAQAINEINHTMRDMGRAQELGPELARYIQVQGDLQQKFEEIKVKVLLKILPIVTNIVSLLEKVMPDGEGVANVIQALTLPLSALASAANTLVGIQADATRPDAIDPSNLIINLNDLSQQTAGLQLP